ncbi:hypothetical protein [Streptomyces synnematoformans]|uniref:Secreted protein n=1 Tax=Streptomyces synnematoformans TaxID=415721 RepID=A0ABN2XTP7_9ACTN
MKRGALGVAGVALVLGALLAVSLAERDQSSAAPAAHEITAVETNVLYDAEQLLIGKCMEHHGFYYRPVSRNPVPEYREFPYVVDDVNWARKHGYGFDVRRRLDEKLSAHPNSVHTAALSPERRQQWFQTYGGSGAQRLTAKMPRGGVLRRSDDGCVMEAQRFLYRNLQDWFQVDSAASDLEGLKQERVVDDGTFTTATRPWARCMHRSGHDYNSPADIRTALQKAPLRKDTNAQKVLAVAEAKCAGQSGLADTARRLDRHHAKAVAAEYPTHTNLKLRLEREALPRARAAVRQLTSSSPSPEIPVSPAR